MVTAMAKNTFEFSNQETQDQIILAAYLAELQEWDNRSHLERIRRFVSLIATSLGIPEAETRIISIASQLHDVGKILIPEHILKKSGNLEPYEWSITERHTIDGANLLKGSNSVYFQAGELIALSHHERWDGSGYPNKLKGTEIPVSGRICAIADVFDALTTKRSYKDEVHPREALELIKDSSGTLFDPEIVQAFTANFNEFVAVSKSVR
jgi:putative two-component system response regulator